MGGTTFEHYQEGADVRKAFDAAHDTATYESGHGGYSGTLAEKGSFVIITHDLLSETEAYALARRLVDEDDRRISDKWGPAGAIPVISDRRKESLADFEYVYRYDSGYHDEALKETVTQLLTQNRKLKKGETVESVWLTSYQQPHRSPYSYTRPTSETRTKCNAVVTILKAPVTRKQTVKVSTPGGLDWPEQEKALRAAVEQTIRLKKGERLIGVTQSLSKTAGKPKVTTTANPGKAVTRYVVSDTDRATWERGFATQAEARKFATEHAKRSTQGYHARDLEYYGIVGITRREDGQPLVSVSREITQNTYEVEVEIAFASRNQDTPDGWLFFGWASC